MPIQVPNKLRITHYETTDTLTMPAVSLLLRRHTNAKKIQAFCPMSIDLSKSTVGLS